MTNLNLIIIYLLGAFPSGRLIAHLKGVDIAQQGSGNVGATNVARVVGKKAGIATLVLDICKGYFAVYLGHILTPETAPIIVGLVAVLGHCLSLPPFLKGGKGVATSIGGLLAVNLSLSVVALSAFIICFAFTRIVSAASIISAASTAAYSWIFYYQSDPILCFGCSALACLIIMRHNQNLARLCRGQEPKFGTLKQ